MAKLMRDLGDYNPTPVPLLVAAHCSTIRRKAKRIDTQELGSIFDDLVRELKPTIEPPSKTYLNSLNEVVMVLNSSLPPALLDISSHYIFTIIRNTVRNLLQQLCLSKHLNNEEIYILRNCILLFHYIVKKINDVLKILHWITDTTFLDALADCLDRIDKISKKDPTQHITKQISRLLGIFSTIQERLPIDFHQSFFVRLLQPTIDCLTSLDYVNLFQSLQADTISFTGKQKLFLIKCPYFLTTYNGPHIEKAIEKILEIMLPRYVSILDQHMKTIKEWKRPIMRAIHNLIITIVYAEGFFTPYLKTESFRALINHLLNILSEPTLINKIHPSSNNIETLVIDATLVVFSVLVYESDALDYIKKHKPTGLFRQLTKAPYETIVLNAYMMLAYTIDDNDIKTSQTNLTQLLSTTYNLLRKTIDKRQKMNPNQTFDQENIDRNILQLLETLKGLSQYEHIRNEILDQGILTFLIDCSKKLHGLSRQVLLECLWKLSFNDRIAQHLRENSQFINSLEDIPKADIGNIPQNPFRRSNSFITGQRSASTALMEATNRAIQRVADGLLWKIVKEPQFREKSIEKMQKQIQTNDQQKYKYDIMISYCYADKDIVYKIHQLLANEGYKIWFDRDHNNGLAMETIAKAMENSELVIICMSDSYKRDNHCQAQAECVLISKRPLLPLVVHSGYKHDGWLSSIIKNVSYIDFGTYDFKVASELLLKEVKQRLRREKEPDVKPTVSTPADIVRNPSGSAVNEATNSSRSSFPPVVINRQQQGLMNSTSRSSTSGAAFIVSPIIISKQQPAPIQSVPTSSIPNSFPSGAPVIINKQQQPTASMHSIPKSSSPGAPSSTIPTDIQQREVLVYSGSRPATPDSDSSNPTVINLKHQQDKSVQTIPRSLTPAASTSTISTITDKQQQQTSSRSVSRSATPADSAPTAPAVIDKQQTSTRPISRSGTPADSAPTAPAVIDKQQTSTRSVSRSGTPADSAPTAPVVVDKQQQQPTNSVTRTPSTGAVPSVAFTAVVQQQQQQPTNSVTRTPSTSAVPSVASTAAVQQQHRQQQPTNSVTRTPSTSAVPSVASTAAVQQQHQQQQPTNSVTRTPSTGAVPSVVSTAVVQQQQQQRPSSRSNSRATTPAALSAASQTTGHEQVHLPEKYTNRQTHNSTYRATSINAWKNNDVLDYLFDSHLYPMMPLCESMSGKALIRLFRICQRKPSRVYDQLNEELRTRFKGLSLSMGTYTQFLIEMDNLVGPEADAIPPKADTAPKITERVIIIPRAFQQSIPSPQSPASLTGSTISSIQSQITTPMEILSGTTTPSSTRIVERAIYRPASNVGRPYDFIVESVEESTALLNQVQRYGPQLLLLDETARHHREKSNHR